MTITKPQVESRQKFHGDSGQRNNTIQYNEFSKQAIEQFYNDHVVSCSNIQFRPILYEPGSTFAPNPKSNHTFPVSPCSRVCQQTIVPTATTDGQQTTGPCSKALGFGIDRILAIDSKTKDANDGLTLESCPKQAQPQIPRCLPTQLNCPACQTLSNGFIQSAFRYRHPSLTPRIKRHVFHPVPFTPHFPSIDLHISSKRKRSWSRTVFSALQRKGLERRFKVQKYVSKPDRRQLAAMLGLTDAQVKVWFQNRRMKWRHSQEYDREDTGFGTSTGDRHKEEAKKK